MYCFLNMRKAQITYVFSSSHPAWSKAILWMESSEEYRTGMRINYLCILIPLNWRSLGTSVFNVAFSLCVAVWVLVVWFWGLGFVWVFFWACLADYILFSKLFCLYFTELPGSCSESISGGLLAEYSVLTKKSSPFLWVLGCL